MNEREAVVIKGVQLITGREKIRMGPLGARTWWVPSAGYSLVLTVTDTW